MGPDKDEDVLARGSRKPLQDVTESVINDTANGRGPGSARYLKLQQELSGQRGQAGGWGGTKNLRSWLEYPPGPPSGQEREARVGHSSGGKP